MKLNHKSFGSGPPLIILHGLFGMLDNWRTMGKMLEGQYQCILVDLRNHGRSPRSDEMNYEAMATDVLQLMDSLHIQNTYLMGHSMGGKVAMQLTLAHPDRIDKLIVVDISPKKYPVHHKSEIKAIESINPSKLSNRSEAEEKLSHFLGDDQATIQFILKNLNRLPAGGFEWKANMPVLIGNYSNLMEPVTGPAFEKPVLFIRGSRSDSVRDEDWPLVLSLFPAAKLLTVPDAGHWVHADQPEALKEHLLTFLHS